MANEISLDLNVRARKGNLDLPRRIRAKFDLTGTNYFAQIQNVGTAQEDLAIGDDITTPGFAIIINHDDANFVTLSRDGIDSFAKLRPGWPALIPLDGTTYYIQADTAACDVEVIVLEE